MKQKGEVIKRIEKPFICDNCIQYMFPYEDTLTILNREGILYHIITSTIKFIYKK